MWPNKTPLGGQCETSTLPDRLGLETADDEIRERLVVALHAEQCVGAEVLLESGDQVRGTLVAQSSDDTRRQVEEVAPTG